MKQAVGLQGETAPMIPGRCPDEGRLAWVRGCVIGWMLMTTKFVSSILRGLGREGVLEASTAPAFRRWLPFLFAAALAMAGMAPLPSSAAPGRVYLVIGSDTAIWNYGTTVDVYSR